METSQREVQRIRRIWIGDLFKPQPSACTACGAKIEIGGFVYTTDRWSHSGVCASCAGVGEPEEPKRPEVTGDATANPEVW